MRPGENLRELREVVVADLIQLGKTWPDGRLDDHTLRRDSGILRRLLVDDRPLLQRYRKALGMKGEPRIEAIDVTTALASYPPNSVTLAAAGFVSIEGVDISPMVQTEDTWPPSNPSPLHWPRRSYRLSDFLSAPCLMIDNVKIDRRSLIKYVANKLGGVHYDTRRKADERQFIVLDKNIDNVKFVGKNLVYCELLAMGQHLLRSPDVLELLPASERPSIPAPWDR